jgi:iron complex transport system substrate-binding protein
LSWGRSAGWSGFSTHSDFPEHAKGLPRIGTYVRPDVERILALKPDLCLAVKDGNPKVLVERLETLGIPVYAVDPKNLSAIMEAVRGIGEVLGSAGKAEAVTDEMQQRIEAVAELAANARSRPRVFYQIGLSPMVSVGKGSFLHEMIELAGGINLAAGEELYPRFSSEEVVTPGSRGHPGFGHAFRGLPRPGALGQVRDHPGRGRRQGVRGRLRPL